MLSKDQHIVLVHTIQGTYVVYDDEVIHQDLPFISPYHTLLMCANYYGSKFKVSLLAEPAKPHEVIAKANEYINSLRPEVQDVKTVPTFTLLTPSGKNHRTMKTVKQNETVAKTKAHVQTGAVTAVGIVFGTAHFLFQSAADATCYAEAKIVKGIGAHQESVEQIMAKRRELTKSYQNELLDVPAKARAKAEELRQQIIEKSQKQQLQKVS